jgi:hypothetical protein
MATVVSSQSLAAAATLTSSAFSAGVGDTLSVTITNGGTPPTNPCFVSLQMSPDNVNWTEVDRRSAGFGASKVYTQVFILANYFGNANNMTAGGFANANIVGWVPWAYYRLVFTGNTDQAVTIAASSNASRGVAIVPLAGTTLTTGGAIGSWLPPEGGAGVVITRCIANITAKSTGAANLTAGVAANATTSASNLIAATAVGSAAVVADSFTSQIIAATAAESGIQTLAIAMTANQAVTFTGSASTAGLVGTAFIEYYLAP